MSVSTQDAQDRPRHRVGRALRAMLLDGRLKPGTRLPSEQMLATQFSVARTTVRSVLEQLERENLIEPSRGRGSRRLVSSVLQTPTGSVLADTTLILNDGPSDAEALRPRGTDTSIHAGVLDELARIGRHALSLQASRLTEEQMRRLCADRPRGVIALNAAVRSPMGRQALHVLRENGVPIVIYGDSAEVPGSDVVSSDHEQGSCDVTQYLLGKGCRRILPLWQLESEDYEQRPRWLAQRRAGYERAMREAGVESIEPLVFRQMALWPIDTAERFEQHVRLTTGYLVEYFRTGNAIDAILAVSDDVALLSIAALRRLGLEPNKDVLVAGYDQSWRSSPLRAYESMGPIITVDKQNALIGAELARLLAERLDASAETPPRAHQVPIHLVTAERKPDR